MRFALAMGCSIKELFERFGNELKWWIAYDRVEPIGEFRGDFRIGQLCAIMSEKESSPLDHMPFFNQNKNHPKQQSDQEMLAILGLVGLKVVG
ncbi:hypothetical protein LCGC14_2290250 [marine sediment metagenome]|uniref:Minor tail T domain-containing protein n=1 Tax=marine sediment metagenome TaxID=412755 RepID=A0A0F9CS04_9ZZZZ